jgi:hypothetical protein
LLQRGIASEIGTEFHCAPSRIRFLYLPAAFGYKRLTEYFANLQKVLIEESARYNRYSDRHPMCSCERRNVDDRHMHSLYEISLKELNDQQPITYSPEPVESCTAKIVQPKGASSTTLGVIIAE